VLNKKPALVLAISWTVLVAVLSLMSIGKFGDTVEIPNKDKFVHFVFYFVFVVSWYLYFKAKNNFKYTGVSIVLIAISFGVFIEICQATLTKERHGDILDVLANSLGAISGYLFIKYLLKNKTT
jgi:VanZ family protein